MSDEIDRSIEPQFGAEVDSAKKMSPGVRIKSRKGKSVDIEEGKSPVAKKASKRKAPKKSRKTKSTIPNLVENEAAKIKAESNDISKDSNQESKLDVDQAVSSLSENLISTVRAMEENGSRLYEQERNFIDSLSEFQEHKEAQQKTSTIMLVSSMSALFVSITFLILAITTFSTKNEIFNSVSTALGTRIVEMNGSLETFEEARFQLLILQEQIEGLELQIEESQISYISTEQDIQGQLLSSEQDIQGQLLTYTQEINKEITDQTANLRENLARLDGRFSAFNAQILDFGDVLDQSEVTLNEIGSEARSLNEMKEIMEALLTLEKERYYEAINGNASQNRIGNNESLPVDGGPTFNRYYTQ
jgi:KaiC/GvpD/RAD55 family RecA-like ATPase